MNNKENLILKAITILSEIDATHLDHCSIQELAQFQYWLYKHQGAIFVKAIGRLDLRISGLERKRNGI